MVSSIILFLGEHHSQALLGGIRLQQERLVKIREHQYRCRLDFSLQDVHSLLHFGGVDPLDPSSLLSLYVIQGVCYVGKSLDKPPVMPH